jgi:hypothetical protein
MIKFQCCISWRKALKYRLKIKTIFFLTRFVLYMSGRLADYGDKRYVE